MTLNRRNAIRKIAQKQGIQLVDVKESGYDQQIGYLAGITGFKRSIAGSKEISGGKEQKIDREMVIFCGMNSGQIDAFMDAWKNSGETRIELKAMVTFTNIFWTPRSLFGELSKENTFFNK